MKPSLPADPGLADLLGRVLLYIFMFWWMYMWNMANLIAAIAAFGIAIFIKHMAHRAGRSRA